MSAMSAGNKNKARQRKSNRSEKSDAGDDATSNGTSLKTKSPHQTNGNANHSKGPSSSSPGDHAEMSSSAPTSPPPRPRNGSATSLLVKVSVLVIGVAGLACLWYHSELLEHFHEAEPVERTLSTSGRGREESAGQSGPQKRNSNSATEKELSPEKAAGSSEARHAELRPAELADVPQTKPRFPPAHPVLGAFNYGKPPRESAAWLNICRAQHKLYNSSPHRGTR